MKKDEHLKKIKYVQNFGNILLSLQKEGYIIFNPKNEICSNIEMIGFDKEFGLTIDQIVYYSDNSNINNGYHTSLNDLKKSLNKFRFVSPKNLEKINLNKKAE